MSNLGPVEKLGSNMGPDSAEHPLKSLYKTQNRAKRCNRLDNRNCFGTRGSEVQILSPRPILKDLSELTVGAIGRNSGRVKPNPTLCAVIVRNIPSIFTPVRA
jgi:hypothetical protein